jgi:hypothetical protein
LDDQLIAGLARLGVETPTSDVTRAAVVLGSIRMIHLLSGYLPFTQKHRVGLSGSLSYQPSFSGSFHFLPS